MSTIRLSRPRRRAVAALAGVAALLGAPGLRSSSAGDGQFTVTAVGNGDGRGIGDGGPAADARLDGPRMIAFDGRGGYYIADTYHHRIRHVDADGIITTYAGTGRAGFQDGPAAQAQFNAPHSVAMDGAGNVFVGDPVNDRVRRIDARTREVTTIAGNGKMGYAGDGGPATDARLNDSKVVVIGPRDGHLYIGDYGNSVIRRVRTDTQPWTIETFAGNPDPAVGFGAGRNARDAFFKPRNMTFDVDGDLIVADRESNTVRSIEVGADGLAGAITTIAGMPGTTGFEGDGGPALEATLFEPRGLGVDWQGNVYIADSSNNRVRKVDSAGIITTVAGTGDNGKGGEGGPPNEADLNNPRHITFTDDGTAFITDTGSSRIMKVAAFIPPNPNPRPILTPAPAPAPEPAPAPAPAPGPSPQPGGTQQAITQHGSVEGRSGYWMLASDGRVYPFGDASDLGSAPAGRAVDLEPTPSGRGYWLVDDAGRVHPRGDAPVLGELRPGALNGPEKVTSLSATPSGAGYWIFTSTGRAVAFGDAAHFGDMGAVKLNGAVLDSIPTATGRGYYMVAADGGIFAFGDATFHGSMGGSRLNAPVQSLVPDPDGTGYWLVAADGGIFAFKAPFRGSMGSTRLNRPVTGMVPFGNGYLMVGEDGGVFNFSDRAFAGSLGDRPPSAPIVAVAVAG